MCFHPSRIQALCWPISEEYLQTDTDAHTPLYILHTQYYILCAMLWSDDLGSLHILTLYSLIAELSVLQGLIVAQRQSLSVMWEIRSTPSWKRERRITSCQLQQAGVHSQLSIVWPILFKYQTGRSDSEDRNSKKISAGWGKSFCHMQVAILDSVPYRWGRRLAKERRRSRRSAVQRAHPDSVTLNLYQSDWCFLF